MTKQLDHQALKDFTRRYTALWTEADPQARSGRSPSCGRPPVRRYWWTRPQEVRNAATALAFPVPRLEVRGHDEIEHLVTRAYAMLTARDADSDARLRLGDR